MATFNKFQDFVDQLGRKGHDLNTDTLKLALTNVAPLATQTAFDPVTAHAAPAAANGYTAGGEDILNTWSEVGGVGTLDGTNITYLAAGGSIGPFQYLVLYNDTSLSKAVVGYYDHGSSITLADGESFVADILTNLLTLQ